MELVCRGRVEGGRVVLADPLSLPDGTEVVLRIEPVVPEVRAQGTPGSEDFASLPVFGMWADREDMRDGAAWVRREREAWQQRGRRPD